MHTLPLADDILSHRLCSLQAIWNRDVNAASPNDDAVAFDRDITV
jgi:hypothetical protein